MDKLARGRKGGGAGPGAKVGIHVRLVLKPCTGDGEPESAPAVDSIAITGTICYLLGTVSTPWSM